MIVLLVTCLAALLCPSVHSQSVAWCYNEPSCKPTNWSTIAPLYCNGSKQSPIDIVTANVQGNANLTSFNFTGFDDNSTFLSIVNTGDFVEINLNSSKMTVQGGDLPGLYNSIQLTLHWGNGSSSNGSEHTVNGKQYPMELQILNVNSKYANLSAALTANDNTGLAVLSFFIEAAPNKINKWDNLTSLFTAIANSTNTTTVMNQITMDNLLEGVDRTKYYRYQGSLTTPNCNEVVIWTVFKDTIKVSQDVINRFSTMINFKPVGNLSAVSMTNNFRGVQPLNGRNVTSQPSAAPSSAATSTLSIITVLLLSRLF